MPTRYRIISPTSEKVTVLTGFHADGTEVKIELRQNPFLPHHKRNPPASKDLFRVVIIDNDTNTYEQVIRICMQALQISQEEAFKIALAVDHNGEAVVFEGTQNEAAGIAAMIRTIGIEVQLRPVLTN